MRKLRVNFKATSKDLVIENPMEKGVLLDPACRVMSVAVDSEDRLVKYLFPLDAINYVEDIMEKQRIQLIPGNMVPKVS